MYQIVWFCVKQDWCHNQLINARIARYFECTVISAAITKYITFTKWHCKYLIIKILFQRTFRQRWICNHAPTNVQSLASAVNIGEIKYMDHYMDHLMSPIHIAMQDLINAFDESDSIEKRFTTLSNLNPSSKHTHIYTSRKKERKNEEAIGVVVVSLLLTLNIFHTLL